MSSRSVRSLHFKAVTVDTLKDTIQSFRRIWTIVTIIVRGSVKESVELEATIV